MNQCFLLLITSTNLEAEHAPRDVVRHGQVAGDGGDQVSRQLALPEAEELVPAVVAPVFGVRSDGKKRCSVSKNHASDL